MRFTNEIDFQNQEDSMLRGVHYYLNNIYYNIHYGEEENDSLDEKKFSQFKKIESLWISSEKSKCLKQYDCLKPVINDHVVKESLYRHPVFDHPLFNYLMNHAGKEELKQFILNESVLNLEFFDYLSLSIVGVSDNAKSEIISNLWDEAGRGDIQKFHTVLFSNFMRDLGLKYDRKDIIANMSWQGIAGINLFNYLASYSFNKIKYFGMLAATEMLDPYHYGKLIQGISLLFKSESVNYDYYIEHEVVDVQHANSWLNNIIIPELSKKPHKTEDFWLGFYMRLNSAKQYYDHLLKLFTIQYAA